MVKYYLHRKTLPAPARARSIRVVERKPFAVQSTGKLQRGVEQVEKTFQVGDHLYAVVFEYLIVGFGLVVEIHFIRQAGTASGGHTDPHEEIIGDMAFLPYLDDLVFGAI